MLLNLSPEFTYSGTFTNANNLLTDLEGSKPDLVLMDIDMPGINGIKATKMIKKRFGALSVLMQTNRKEDERIFESLRAGANGYLLKMTTPRKGF